MKAREAPDRAFVAADVFAMRPAALAAHALAVALLAFALGGCSTIPQIVSRQDRATIEESMLLAAGFRSLPEATAKEKQRLGSLPAFQLNYYTDQNGESYYWMADPDYCHCLFHGDTVAYERYEVIKLQNQIAAREQRRAALQQIQTPNHFGVFGQHTGVVF